MPELVLACKSTVRQLLAEGAGRLSAAGVDLPGLDARLLLGAVLGLDHAKLILSQGDNVEDNLAHQYENHLVRRIAREPVSRILGTREFFGRNFSLDSSVLDPRPDTEVLVEAALKWAKSKSNPVRILDLGTGSGAILLTLLAEMPNALGVGVDISEAALSIAKANARALGVVDRAGFVCSSWDAGVDGRFDLVVSNPPYIKTGDLSGLDLEVSRYDPQEALDGGRDGLDAYRAIAHVACARLTWQGCLMVEIGADQGNKVIEIFTSAGLNCQVPLPDLGGRDRVVVVPIGLSSGICKKALGMAERSG